MKYTSRIHGIGVAVGIVVLALVSTAWAGGEDNSSRWRLEISGMRLFDNDWKEGADFYYTGSVEYELGLCPHLTLGIKALPLFYYPGPDTVYGVGGGVTARVYQHKDQYDGLFGEVGGSVLWHSQEFEHDNSKVDFVTGAGLGFQFRKVPLHLTLRVEHISNGGLEHPNHGFNGVGVATGVNF